jgi:hypothetical protein
MSQLPITERLALLQSCGSNAHLNALYINQQTGWKRLALCFRSTRSNELADNSEQNDSSRHMVWNNLQASMSGCLLLD